MTFAKDLKYVLVTLACLMIISSFLESRFGTTGAYTPSGGWPEGQPYFTLWAVLNPDAFWGLYGGYHDIWYMIQPEFAKIGIDLNLFIQGDMYDNWYLIWESPLGGRPPGKPPSDWDLTSMEWRIRPQGMLGVDGIILSKYITPYGSNVFPYLNNHADSLYWKMQTSFIASRRQEYAWAWQRKLMRNPPMINIYYPDVYHVRGRYIQGYDPTVWWYDISNLYVNQTIVDTLGPAKLGTENYDRLSDVIGDTTIIYGAGEAWWSYLNLYCDSNTEEAYQNLVSGTLYKPTLDPWPAEEGLPQVEHFTIRPHLASDEPANQTIFTDDDGEEVVSYRIPLRKGVLWSDGVEFTAEDVKFSHDYSLDPNMLSTAYGDFAPIVKRVEYCDNDGNNVSSTDDPNYDPYSIRYVLYDDYVDLKLILGNIGGAGIMPEHALKDIPRYSLRNSPENKHFGHGKTMPSLGPYVYWAESAPSGYSDITFERNPLYFGYNASIVGSAWGPYGIDKIIFKYSPDAEVRFAEMETHDIDFGDCPVAWVEDFEDLKAEKGDEFIIQKAPYMASNSIWMNFNNPNLSNRYVRLALAYAIPYPKIFSEILPSWGIVNPFPGISFIHPQVSLFNKKLEPYTYNLAKAKQYLDMWLYSQTGETEYTKGPVGDANFDGEVGLRDVFLTIDELGKAPLTRQIGWWNNTWSEGIYPWPVASGASVAPGNDVDADFNNDGTVTISDFVLCAANWGKEYPFPGSW